MEKIQQKRLPVLVVTGFLGAGKTTLLRNLLRQSNQRLAVIVNEFGEIGIDGALLSSCIECESEQFPVLELANGCLCCTVQDDFLPTIEKLLAHPNPLDGIVIETSGLALPEPLLKAFQWPQIKHRTHVYGVVTVVDGEALAAGSVLGNYEAIEKQKLSDPSLDHQESIEDLFREQLEQADLVLISRSDLLNNEQMKSARQFLAEQIEITQPPHLPSILKMANGDISPEFLLGLNRPDITDEDKEEHHHNHPELIAASIQLRGHWLKEGLAEFLLADVIGPMALIRLKGRIPIKGKSRPLQVQAVGNRLNLWFEADGLANDQLELVIIGVKPEADKLKLLLEMNNQD
jgi:cobalamin biosynthesis protein CobW